jgi:putative nucleotidyltransferase with HDIG domain
MATIAPPTSAAFTRGDLRRLLGVTVLLVAAMTAVLGIDILPPPVTAQVGSLVPTDIRAPRAQVVVSQVRTEEARQAARTSVLPQYDYTTEKALAIAAEQTSRLRQLLIPNETAFGPSATPEQRTAILADALPSLSPDARTTLQAVPPNRWATIREEALRVLDVTERTELKDSEVAPVRARITERMAGGLNEAERMLVAELIGPLLIPNSSFSLQLTNDERERRAALVAPVTERILQGEVIVRGGTKLTEADLEKLEAFGLTEARPDLARLAGWFVLAGLLASLLLAWIWRFRRTFWHRTNVLVLIGLMLVVATVVLKLTAGRAALPFVLPMASIGMLMAVLLDGGTALVVHAVVSVLAGAVNSGSGSSLEISAYVFLAGLAGIIAIRRGDRLQTFLQAGVVVALVNAAVVSVFSLLGERDLTGIMQLWGASLASGAGAAIASAGSFAVLGSVFGIVTVFQLLELANPSQPLLRRLLVETPGTYHHSIIVGNLAERAAEAIGADPLITRVAAYYHDVGKLANPMAFIENQGGAENIHDQLEPDVSAQLLKQHVADGIDIAYAARLPTNLIAFIPQHHGTTLMSYFLARAREQAAEPYGGLETTEGRKAAGAIVIRKFRHAGPKPQSREAALIMLADGVEASVRSLASRDESTIRAMVDRIFLERVEDGQFDECDLTLRDLEKTKEAFVGQLLGMYHTRIAYPQNRVVELESRRAAALGGLRRRARLGGDDSTPRLPAPRGYGGERGGPSVGSPPESS